MNQTPASFTDPEPVPAPQTVRVRMPSTPPTVTYVLIAVTVVFYILQQLATVFFGYAIYDIGWLEFFGARINSAILAGQLWRLITPVFLHGSLMHIFFNMYALLSVGSFLERHLGHVRFILLYFLGAFAGNVFSFLFTGSNGYSLGASTAVFGLIAAEAVFFFQNRSLFGAHAKQAIGNAVIIIFINLFIGLAPGIDNWGHMGGLLGGAMFAWFASPRWAVIGIPPDMDLLDQREAREIITGVGLVILVFGALAAAGFFIQ